MAHFSTFVALAGLLALAGAAQAQTAPTFTLAATLGGGSLDKPNGLVVADVNQDGLPDLLTANYNTNTVGVLLGTGTGSFGPVAQFGTGTQSRPFNLKVADMNGDGKLDVLTANYASNTVGLLLGTGTGSFGPVATFGTGGSTPFNLAVADVNADGKPDVLAVNRVGNNVGVLLGTGTGSFGTVTTFGTGDGPNDIAVGDVNGDAKPDIIVAIIGSSVIKVLLGTGAGSFGAAATFSMGPSNFPEGIALADVNADGKLDVLTAGNPVTVLLGTGTGSFGPATTFSTGSGARKVAVADVNGDNKPDLLTANISTSTVSALAGTGTGSFTAASNFGTGTDSGPIALAVADVNGDGKPDVLTANYGSSTISVLLNTTPLPTRAALPGVSASLAPNPASAATTLHVAGLPAGITEVQATVLDATGREVARHRLAARQGAAQADLATAGLAPGLYVVRLLGHDGQGAPAGELPAQRLSVQ